MKSTVGLTMLYSPFIAPSFAFDKTVVCTCLTSTWEKDLEPLRWVFASAIQLLTQGRKATCKTLQILCLQVDSSRFKKKKVLVFLSLTFFKQNIEQYASISICIIYWFMANIKGISPPTRAEQWLQQATVITVGYVSQRFLLLLNTYPLPNYNTNWIWAPFCCPFQTD